MLPLRADVLLSFMILLAFKFELELPEATSLNNCTGDPLIVVPGIMNIPDSSRLVTPFEQAEGAAL